MYSVGNRHTSVLIAVGTNMAFGMGRGVLNIEVSSFDGVLISSVEPLYNQDTLETEGLYLHYVFCSLCRSQMMRNLMAYLPSEESLMSDITRYTGSCVQIL